METRACSRRVGSEPHLSQPQFRQLRAPVLSTDPHQWSSIQEALDTQEVEPGRIQKFHLGKVPLHRGASLHSVHQS
ncbi:hypothetical protein U0070_017659 [Myodes glareolus]|uniref:Uncharacterized protein n=1 Tax=Myodes glareolus TaxID=447135 RepID=A0AAW0K6R7_MYOGA